jgi:hypothetical protein
MKQIVYVAGKYRSKWGLIGRIINILKARKVAIRLWQKGYIVICPHLNTALFDGYCPDDTWLEGDIAILERCDVIYMLKDWNESRGARIEYREAVRWGLEVMYEQGAIQLTKQQLQKKGVIA